MAKSFEERLDEALNLADPLPNRYSAMVAKLEEIVQVLQRQVDGGSGRATVTIEPGHLVNAGLQSNVVVQIPQRNRYRDTLFRAYVPASGSPVTLDLIGDEPITVRTPEELEDAVVRFLARPEIRTMLRQLRELAARTP